jgi:hypothetical protein
MRGRNPQGWAVEMDADDEETRVYFEPETDPLAEPATTALPAQPPRSPALATTGLQAQPPARSVEIPTPVRSFEVDGTWRVPSLSPKSVVSAAPNPPPLRRVPASTNPPPVPRQAPPPLTRIPAATNPPPLTRIPAATNPPPPRAHKGTGPVSLSRAMPAQLPSTAYAMPSAASLPHFEPSILAMAHPRPSRASSRRFQRPALGVFVAAACVLVGIGVGGFLAATGHSHATAEAAPAKIVMSPTVAMSTTAPIVEPIVEAQPQPQPSIAAAAVTAPPPAPAPEAAPAKLPPPQPTFAAVPKHHHTTVVAAPAEAGSGKLAVSSKPPCSIVIDGKNTGLVAPQRAIELAAGKHEITLINVEEGIHLTTEVAITADRSTQLIRDFTN